jgi:ABC-type transporter Mla subunit MlaD
MRRIALMLALLAAAAAAFVANAGADDEHTYSIEMYNAFGLVQGSDVRIAGVNAGEVTGLDINSAKRAVVTVDLSGPLSVLGTRTRCSSEPQSLIAEYFIDCQPHGPPIEHSDDPEHPDIPASRVEQTVQTDLAQNTFREPFKRRLQLLVNEFGTALAGNGKNLNEAIRLGAPALTRLERVTRVLGDQNEIIRDLNVDSDRIMARLAQRRDDVVRFIENANRTTTASSERADDLSRDFGMLDDFLARLDPTLSQLGALAREQTPLLADLRASAPGLDRLVLNLPGFNSATEDALAGLGDASVVGRDALRDGRDEIDLLAKSGRQAPAVGEILADFLRDVDDPKRAVETDARAARSCAQRSRSCSSTGRSAPTGYTGLEGLLNYAYYQAGATNQWDSIGHLLHFSLYYAFTGPCGNFTTGRDPETGAPGLPADPRFGGGTTTDIAKLEPCIGWLGPNQPGINQSVPVQPYDPSVCPNGTMPAAAEASVCSPSGTAESGSGLSRREPSRNGSGGGGGGEPGTGPLPGLPGVPDVPQVPNLPQAPDLPGGGNGPVGDALDRILHPNRHRHRHRHSPLDDLGGRLGEVGQRLGDAGGRLGLPKRSGGGGAGAAGDLLDFLLGP